MLRCNMAYAAVRLRPEIALMRQEQRRGTRFGQEIAGDAAEQEFAHPAAAIGPHHQQLPTLTGNHCRQRFFGRSDSRFLVELSLDRVAREVGQRLGRGIAAGLLGHRQQMHLARA